MKSLLSCIAVLLSFSAAVFGHPSQVKLTAVDAADGDVFGFSVSVDGDTVIVGAHGDDYAGSDSGSAYVFVRNEGGADTWGQVIKLTATDGAARDLFGYSVSIDGDTTIVGAFADDDGGYSSGSAYVFGRNQGGTNNWGQVMKLTAADATESDEFGRSVSVDGDTAIVGALLHRRDATGSAYVFSRDQGGMDNWGQVVKLTASDAAADDFFGTSVSVNGDTAIVGAAFDSDAVDRSGSAYIFGRNQGGVDSWGQVMKLMAADAGANDRFGHSVSIYGDTAIVGAFSNDDAGNGSGSAYIFGRNQGGVDNWGQVMKLTAADAAVTDQFGESVSVDEDTAIVGAQYDRDSGILSGSAYVFSRDEGGTNNWGQVMKLTARDGAELDLFGGSVSVDGETAIVGAWSDDGVVMGGGSAYILFGALNTILTDHQPIPALRPFGIVLLVLGILYSGIHFKRKLSGVTPD